MGVASNLGPLANKSNADILNAIRYDAGLDYQNRIPEATKGDVKRTMSALLENRPLMNQFVDALVNRIGLSIMRTDAMWNNPLAQFKLPDFVYGDTIQEYMVGLVKSYTYDSDRETTEKDVWSVNAPHVEQRFHQINRREKYKITVNHEQLRGAFISGEPLGEFITAVLASPVKSDHWDEFLATMALVAEYENNGGYYHMRIPSLSNFDSTADDARYTLQRMRALAGNMPYLSTKYNSAHMPVHANPEDMVLLATPEFQASIDVNALAGAFNMEKMSSPYSKVITVPKEHFGVDYCEAILTTKDHFLIADNLYQNTSIQDPSSMNWQYWTHHWQLLSVSQFTPAIMFNTRYDDEVIELRKPVTGLSAITFLPDSDGKVPTEAMVGDHTAFDVTVTTNAIREGVMWAVSGQTSAETFMTSTGVLHVSPFETAKTLKVRAISTYVDPSKPTAAPFKAEISVKVTGSPAAKWPLDHKAEHTDGNDDADGDGTVDPPKPVVP